jgi:hypothetical protein
LRTVKCLEPPADGAIRPLEPGAKARAQPSTRYPTLFPHPRQNRDRTQLRHFLHSYICSHYRMRRGLDGRRGTSHSRPNAPPPCLFITPSPLWPRCSPLSLLFPPTGAPTPTPYKLRPCARLPRALPPCAANWPLFSYSTFLPSPPGPHSPSLHPSASLHPSPSLHLGRALGRLELSHHALKLGHPQLERRRRLGLRGVGALRERGEGRGQIGKERKGEEEGVTWTEEGGAVSSGQGKRGRDATALSSAESEP